MNTLSFGNNWRRELLLTKSASADDMEEICDYILLNEDKLPKKVRAFCEENWNEYGFDYDTTTFMLWPANDGITAQVLHTKLNTVFPGCAKIVKKSISDAHNLSLMWSSDEEDDDILQDDSESDLSF